ncbi:MAG: hypothetical protein KIT54_08220 [Phycisphaeraceae bacterium]|nr:hypothetical protein [Phycisphaeraceae bacterium]
MLCGRFILSFAMPLLAGWSTCTAAMQATADNDVAAYVAKLASDNWQERTHATAALLGLTRDLPRERALHTLEDALKHWMDTHDHQARPGDITEVLARYEAAAIEAFFLAPRSGLGVNYDPSQSDRGVTLGGTIEPFDAHGKLRAGDVVVEISGMPMTRGLSDLPVAIASHLPGEQAMIVLDRGGDRLRIPVIIGRREDLRTGQSLDEPLLRRAWAVRSARTLGRTMPEPLLADQARLVFEASASPAPSRVRVSRADVSLGGQPSVRSARHAGVVTSFRLNPIDGNAALREELDRLNRDLTLLNRRILENNNTLAQIDLELSITPNNEQGRAQTEALRQRRSELNQRNGELRREQEALLRERATIIQALSN